MDYQTQGTPLEVWGGIERTVNRVGDRYFDQLARNGHDRREDDLDRIAALGITALRYPLLWERITPTGPGSAEWSWPDWTHWACARSSASCTTAAALPTRA
jgi:dTDP-4-dehydrorhamnose reductase